MTFPLLDNFVQVLRDNPGEYPAPDEIAVLLTDQSALFPDDRQRQKLKCPYWQDTWELQPILQHYFQDGFPGVPCEWVRLQPMSTEQSLDNWNAVLDLVRDQFRALTIAGQQVAIAPGETVYVSHQAGTPALSSAVQFISLASFGNQVKFLVSNKQNQALTDVVKSSSYLRGIEKEKAKKLLDRYDYAGVKDLVAHYLNSEVLILLEAAIQWNFAEFEAFRKQLASHPQFKVTRWKLSSTVFEHLKDWQLSMPDEMAVVVSTVEKLLSILDIASKLNGTAILTFKRWLT